MSLLTLIQDVCNQIGLPSPATVYGSQTLLYKQLLATLETDVSFELKSAARWPELTKTHTITLVDGQDAYALPADLERQLPETHWDQNNQWPLFGPISPQSYNQDVYGLTEPSLRLRYRIKGFATNQFYLTPTPSAADAGHVLSFEYQSTTWCRPATWATGTSYAANQYTFYNGNFYYTTASGTSGATPPTHTSSTASDGGVTWTYSAAPYTRFLKDSDEVILPEYLCMLCLKYIFSEAKGLPFDVHYRRFEKELHRQATKKRGVRTLSLARREKRGLVIARGPETGWG